MYGDNIRVGVLMDFAAYDGRTLQNFLTLLNQCDGQGITDTRLIRGQLQHYLDGRFASAAIVERSVTPKTPRPRLKPEKCPSCGKMSLLPASPLEGLQRIGCKLCGYSQVVGLITTRR